MSRQDINLTVDNFGTPAALIRGLFEFVYTDTSLTLVPRIPDTVVSLTQKFGVRWGAYSLQTSTSGVRTSGIASVKVAGVEIKTFNVSAVRLDYAALPPASDASIKAIGSDLSLAKTRVKVEIMFVDMGENADQFSPLSPLQPFLSSPPSTPENAAPAWDCEAIAVHSGPSSPDLQRIKTFITRAKAEVGTWEMLPVLQARLCLGYMNAFQDRCAGLNNGTVTPLRSPNSTNASLVQLLTTAASLNSGVENIMKHAAKRSVEPAARALVEIWAGLG